MDIVIYEWNGELGQYENSKEPFMLDSIEIKADRILIFIDRRLRE